MFMVGIVLVICILPPVNDCILSVLFRIPHCIEGGIFSNLLPKFVCRTILSSRPETECISRSRRYLWRCCFFFCRNECRLYIAGPFAADKVQIISLLDLRIECHILIIKRNRSYFAFICQPAIGIPARDRLRGVERNHHIRNLNILPACAFLRRADSSQIVKEENIVYLLENRVQVNISGRVHRGCQLIENTRITFLKCSCVLGIGPPHELMSAFLRRSRRINRLAVPYLLRGTRDHISVCIVENISCNGRILFRRANTGDYVDGELACIKTRAGCGGRGDRTCIAVVVDVKNLMALALNAAARCHTNRDSASRFDFIPVFILKRDVDGNRVDDLSILANRVLHTVIVEDAGSGNGLEMHRRAFGEIALIRMHAYMNAAGRPFKILCRHGDDFLEVRGVDRFLRCVLSNCRDEGGILTHLGAVRSRPVHKRISILCCRRGSEKSGALSQGIHGLGSPAHTAALASGIFCRHHSCGRNLFRRLLKVCGIFDFSGHLRSDARNKQSIRADHGAVQCDPSRERIPVCCHRLRTGGLSSLRGAHNFRRNGNASSLVCDVINCDGVRFAGLTCPCIRRRLCRPAALSGRRCAILSRFLPGDQGCAAFLSCRVAFHPRIRSCDGCVHSRLRCSRGLLRCLRIHGKLRRLRVSRRLCSC